MEDCPVKYAFTVVNGKWKLQILWELNQQDMIRFNELQRRLTGISSFMLSKSLGELEQNKLIIREQYNEVPPRVEYSLTELGKAIHPALKMLGDWGTKVYNECQES